MSGALVTPAIVLRRVAYAESDFVVTLLGEHTGRVAGLARGARRSQRRFPGGLGLGASGEARLRDRPTGDLAWLESFEADEPRTGLAADLGRTAHAAYAAELCEKLCAPRHPERDAYAWLLEYLRWLERRGASVVAVRVFELGLLRRLGIGPSLEACAACGRPATGDEAVRWRSDGGGVMCVDGHTAGAARGTMLSAATRRTLARLGTMSFPDTEAERLTAAENVACRRSIAELLEVHVPGVLKSRAFIERAAGRVE